MNILSFREMKPLSQLLFTLFIVVVGFLVIQVLAAVIAILIFGIARVSTMLSGFDISDPETLRMLKYFQVMQSLGLFIIPSFMAAVLFSINPLRYLHLDKGSSFPRLLIVILLVIVINPFISFTGSLNAGMHLPEWLAGIEEWMRTAEDNAERLTRAFLEVNTTGGLLFNLLMMAVLPALGEELLFRGVIQKQLTAMTRSHHWGVWLAAALFSAMHMQFYGFIPRMLLAVLFGYLLVWSRSLWLPILAHFIHNAGAVIAMWLIQKEKINPAFEEFGEGLEYWPWAVGSLVFGLLIFTTLRIQLTNAPPES